MREIDKKDSRKKVGIIDCTNVAIVLDILFQENSLDYIILEEHPKKGGQDQWVPDRYLRAMINIIVTEMNVKNVFSFQTPSMFFINFRKINEAFKIIEQSRKIKKFLLDQLGDYQNMIFYGDYYSSIIQLAGVSPKNIRFIDHGIESVGRMMLHKNEENNKTKKIRDVLKNILYNKIVCVPAMIAPLASLRGYTMFHRAGDWFEQIDYQDFSNAFLSNILLGSKKLCKGKKIGLFLPYSHSEYEFTFCCEKKSLPNSFPLICKDIYNEILSRVKETTDFDVLLIKYHPAWDDGMEKEEIENEKNEMLDICKQYKINAIFLEDFFQNRLLTYLPAELIIKHLGISVLITMGSTTTWNAASDVSKDNLQILFFDPGFGLFPELQLINNINVKTYRTMYS
ncbi:hypothetical protein [Selenomonas noxia]|jgi:hypothetical protein|uniref:hypothetical protein n=1 Tax=Selenomonas noxia TaxID=135083 RepID=UPI0028D69E6A|nr:hypothetical protein [Selenomonas noxia]